MKLGSPAGPVTRGLKRFFFWWGGVLHDHSSAVIVVSVAVALGLIAGITQIESESNVRALWVPNTAPSLQQRDFVLDSFGSPGRFNAVILEAEDMASNLLTKSILLEMLDLHDQIMAIQVKDKDSGTMMSYEDLCIVPIPSGPCFYESILDFWRFNRTALTLDPDVLATINNGNITNSRGQQIVLKGNLVGGFTRNPSGDFLTASHHRFFYLLDEQRASGSTMEQWELEFLNMVLEYDGTGYDTLTFASRTIDDELERSVTSDIALVGVAVGVMVLYVSFSLGKIDKLHSKFITGQVGVMSVMLGVGSGLGAGALLGVKYNAVVQMVIFLVLGVGIDDMYIIVNSYERVARQHPELSLKQRMQYGLEEAGVPITITSLTNVVAFTIAVTNSLPALQAFGQYASLALVMDFVLMISLFSAMVARNARRVHRREREFGFLCPQSIRYVSKDAEASDELTVLPPGAIEVFARDYLSVWLTKPAVKAGIIVLFIGLAGVAGFGVLNLGIGLKIPSDIVPDNSYAIPYFAANDKYFRSQSTDPLILVLRELDYFDDDNQELLIKLQDDLQAGEYIEPGRRSWFDDFLAWVEATKSPGDLNAKLRPSSSTQFHTFLNEFLLTPGGLQYTGDVVFGDSSTAVLSASRIHYEHPPLISPPVRRGSVLESRDIVGASPLPAFPFAEEYIIIEQLLTLEIDTITNLLVASAAICGTTLFFFPNPLTSLFILLGIVLINTGLVGWLYFWDLTLNNVTLATIVLSTGISVDFTAHVIHAFMEATGSRNDRMREALTTMGTSILSGGLTTLLGTAVLAFASSNVFRSFFAITTTLVLLAWAHGLLLIPVLLSMFGPGTDAVDKAAPHLAHKSALKDDQVVTTASTAAAAAVVVANVAVDASLPAPAPALINSSAGDDTTATAASKQSRRRSSASSGRRKRSAGSDRAKAGSAVPTTQDAERRSSSARRRRRSRSSSKEVAPIVEDDKAVAPIVEDDKAVAPIVEDDKAVAPTVKDDKAPALDDE